MKIKLILFALFIPLFLSAQKDQDFKAEIILLANTYKNYHVGGTPSKEEVKQLKAIKSAELLEAKNIILVLSRDYNFKKFNNILQKPDSITLKNLHLIKVINWSFYDSEQPTETQLKAKIDSLSLEEANYFELLSSYYDMAFTHLGNKHRPYDMSKVDFDLNAYHLENDTEKGIFFLQSMETFGTLIWGYINVPNPPNFSKALEFINKYPTYNGQAYFEYKNLDIEDFYIRVDKSEPKKSFKKHLLNKLMNTILYHVLALAQEDKYQAEKFKVLSNSIIRIDSFWEYSETPDVFRQIYSREK